MIDLIQHKVAQSELSSSFNKLNEVSLSVNKELIQKDLSRLRKELEETQNKYNKANLKGLITYLEKLVRSINEECKLELCWVTSSNKEDLPYTYPIKFINEPLYNINTCNYIELESGEHVVEIDMIDLADLIAFEFMYKDLGEDHNSIEELLKDCGIIGYEKSDLLIDRFRENNDKMYELSKSMMIDDSPYKSVENKTIVDYFNSKTFKTKSYKDVVDYSCRYANTVITNNIIKNYLHKDCNIKLLTVNARTITFITDSKNEVDIDEIAIRIFGRRFIIEPKISVF